VIETSQLGRAQLRFDRAKKQFSDAAIAVLQRRPNAASMCSRALREIEAARVELASVHGSPSSDVRAFRISSSTAED
jgi:hypothetical protein